MKSHHKYGDIASRETYVNGQRTDRRHTCKHSASAADFLVAEEKHIKQKEMTLILCISEIQIVKRMSVLSVRQC